MNYFYWQSYPKWGCILGTCERVGGRSTQNRGTGCVGGIMWYKLHLAYLHIISLTDMPSISLLSPSLCHCVCLPHKNPYSDDDVIVFDVTFRNNFIISRNHRLLQPATSALLYLGDSRNTKRRQITNKLTLIRPYLFLTNKQNFTYLFQIK